MIHCAGIMKGRHGTIDTPLLQSSIEEGVANGADARWLDADAGPTEGVASILAFLLTDASAYLPLTIMVDKPRRARPGMDRVGPERGSQRSMTART